jgi:hypothetical protein
VDRSNSSHNAGFYNSNKLQQVDSISLRSTAQHHHGQWEKFYIQGIQTYCESMGIKLTFASVAHPQTNGRVEKANGLICSGIKKRLLAPLEKAKNAWVDELPSVLWSLRTTSKCSNSRNTLLFGNNS